MYSVSHVVPALASAALSGGSCALRHAPIGMWVCTHVHFRALSGRTRCFGLILRISWSSPGISQWPKEPRPEFLLKFLAYRAVYVSVFRTLITWIETGGGAGPDSWVSV